MVAGSGYWRFFLWSFFLNPFFLCALDLPAKEGAKEVKNLLVIMADQMRFDALGAASNDIVKTPHLDRLAREGVFFEKAYTPVPVCAPARAGVLTGQSIENNGIFSNGEAYEPSAFKGSESFDTLLAKAGYRTAYYGKWHSPQVLAARYENLPDYHVTSTSNHAGMGVGMRRHYLHFLEKNDYPSYSFKDEALLPQGQLLDSFSSQPYVLNIMDTKYGLSKKKAKKIGRTDQGEVHGTLLIEKEHSITALEAKGVMSAIDRFAKEPFSLTVSFHYPHPPFTPSEPYASMFDPDDMVLPPNFKDKMVGSAYKDSNKRAERKQFRDPKKVKQFIATYYGLVKEVDDWVGEILAKLDEHKIADKTLVVFLSDHGEMLGSHGMYGKNMFYEESVRVPFIMRLPGEIPKKTRVSDPVSTRDIFATVMDFLGQPIPLNLDSKSLRGLIMGEEKRAFAIAQWRDTPKIPNFMVVGKKWKLLMSKFPGGKSVDALYNLEEDPYEMENLLAKKALSDSEKEAAMVLKGYLLSWLESAGPSSIAGVKERKLF